MLIDGAIVDLEQENRRLQAELQAQTQELRELARGIHPAVLRQRGLGAALESLASRAPLPVARGRLVIDVTDDGCGGASVGAGSGLSGLADRVGALDGRVGIDSPPGRGTCVRVEIPCCSAVPTPGGRFVHGG